MLFDASEFRLIKNLAHCTQLATMNHQAQHFHSQSQQYPNNFTQPTNSYTAIHSHSVGYLRHNMYGYQNNEFLGNYGQRQYIPHIINNNSDCNIKQHANTSTMDTRRQTQPQYQEEPVSGLTFHFPLFVSVCFLFACFVLRISVIAISRRIYARQKKNAKKANKL